MNFRKTAIALLATLLAETAARGEGPGAPPPAVWESDYAEWDAASLSAGDWAEYEVSEPGLAVAAGKKAVRRLACVAADEEAVWIEVTQRNVAPEWEGAVLAVRVSRQDRRVLRACWGKAGGDGAEIEVKPGFPGGGAGPPGGKPAVTATGTVAKEKVKTGAGAFECEKVEIETRLVTSCCDEKARTTTWTSEKVPFAPWIAETPAVAGVAAEMSWQGQPSRKGGLVKRAVFQNNVTRLLTLAKWGRDAKPSLKIREK